MTVRFNYAPSRRDRSRCFEGHASKKADFGNTGGSDPNLLYPSTCYGELSMSEAHECVRIRLAKDMFQPTLLLKVSSRTVSPCRPEGVFFPTTKLPSVL